MAISKLYTNPASYTNRDIVALREKVIETVQGVTDKWTDFNESDVGVMLIELMAGIADQLHFYLDKQALENYLPTVVQEKNAKSIVSLIGYKFTMMVSSVTEETFTLPEPLLEDIIIYKYTQLHVSSSNPQMFFATRSDVRLKTGEVSVKVPIMQGEVKEVTLKVSDLVSQRINLQTNIVAQDSVIISIGDVDWEEVDDVFTEIEPGTKFSVYEDKDNNAYIMLHVNYLDYLPKDGDTQVRIRYLETLGSNGIAQKGAIDTLDTDIKLQSGLSIKDRFVVTNDDSTSGGSDRETLDHARVYAPSILKTMDHAVQLDDYEILSGKYPGVAHSKALDWTIPGNYVDLPYVVDIYIVSGDGQPCNSQQLQDIKSYMETKRTTGITVNVYSANYIVVDIKADVYVFDSPDNYESYRIGIVSKIQESFKISNLSFGTGVRSSNIITLIENYNQNIDYVNLYSPSSNQTLLLNQFPVLGSVDIKILGSDVNVRPN